MAQPADGDIRARIEAVPGARVLGERPAAPGQVVLDLGYRQPTDHRHADQGSFRQRLTPVHKSTRRPITTIASSPPSRRSIAAR
ncbi:hypothetical protein AB0O22_39520 [Streptomyces sp. NPDC091204]|uniref:hypothetical protein n=1 Tax=Streptomyces sp. NPDC091204 TaxID=3155299 RepID=UPI00343ED273